MLQPHGGGEGAWERMIGSARRILDSLLSQVHEGILTNDLLAIFMARVSASTVLTIDHWCQFQQKPQRPLF